MKGVKREQFRRLVRSIAVMIILVLESFIFYYVWNKYYSRGLWIEPFYAKGNIFIVLVYAAFMLLFLYIYGGFKIGYIKRGNLIYSQALSGLCANVIMYLQIVLLYRRLPDVRPLLAMTLADLLVIGICSYFFDKLFSYIFPPRDILLIYGEYPVEKLGGKIATRKDKFRIKERISVDKDFETIADKIKQFSCTKEVITGHCCLLPKSSGFSQSFKNWDGKEDGMKSIDMLSLWNCEKIVSFYNLQLLEGEMVKPTETNKIMINESAVKALGMSEPIGKKLYLDNRAWTITGIIKDFHITAPTEPVQPYTLITEDILKNSGFSIGKGQILIKFHDGKWKELKNRIDSIFTYEYPEVRYKLLFVC